MEIDLKKKGDKVEYISTETSTTYDVNKLRGIKNVGSVYLMNNKTSVLTKTSEVDLKRYFTENKNELMKILHEVIAINKNDYKKENTEMIADTIHKHFGAYYNIDTDIVRYIGEVNELPDNAKIGEIYGLIKDDEINYFIYLKTGYFALMGRTEFEKNYYKKETLNLKLEELNSKLNSIVGTIEPITKNSISKEELDLYLSKLEELKNQLNFLIPKK